MLDRDHIELIPAGVDNFQNALLQTRRARVTAYNASGGVVWEKPWRASKLTAESNLIGNIMTRADVRHAPDAPSIVRLRAEVIR